MEEKDIAKLTHDELMAKTHEDLVAIILSYQEGDTLVSSLLRKELDECEAELKEANEKLTSTQEKLASVEYELSGKTADAENYYRWWQELQSKHDNCLAALLTLVK